MEAGKKYSCYVENYGLRETKNGFMQVWVKLYNKDDHGDSVIWTGTINKPGKPQEIAFKALKAMGFDGNLEGLNNGTDSNALDMNTEVEVETELNNWTDKDGNPRSEIRAKWINSPRSSKPALKPEKVHISKAKFNNEWKAFLQTDKTKDKFPPLVPDTAQKEATTGQPVDTSDVPF